MPKKKSLYFVFTAGFRGYVSDIPDKSHCYFRLTEQEAEDFRSWTKGTGPGFKNEFTAPKDWTQH